MIVNFNHYLHGDKESWADDVRSACEDAGMTPDEAEAVLLQAQMPFYEMSFNCQLDTETGIVTYREINV